MTENYKSISSLNMNRAQLVSGYILKIVAFCLLGRVQRTQKNLTCVLTCVSVGVSIIIMKLHRRLSPPLI